MVHSSALCWLYGSLILMLLPCLHSLGSCRSGAKLDTKLILCKVSSKKLLNIIYKVSDWHVSQP